MRVTLRAATAADDDFLYELHRATMKDYVAKTWKWNESWQQDHFHQSFDPQTCHVILFNDQPIGALSVARRVDEVFLASVEISPEHQRQGIGTFVIRQVLDDAGRIGKPVVLQVLKVNPARRLYERLGFCLIGESETHYIMKAEAGKLSGSALS
jgi:ribosomal protein S18 acetylase RimI-like enzyme